MRPVLRGEIEERQQRTTILEQAIDRLVVFGRIFLGEDRHRGFGGRAVLGQPNFAQIPMGVGLNRLRQLVENVQTLVLPTRWWRVEGNASSRAFQKPSTPSPTAMSGAIDRPRAFRSTSSSFQL